MEVRKRVSAWREIEARFGPRSSPPGVASDYLKHFDPAVHGLSVVLYCRVSMWEYNSLKKQIEDCIKRLEALGVTVVAVVRGVECSWELTDNRRSLLMEAIELAREHGAIVVAASTSRFIRNHRFDAVHNFDVQPTVWEYERLKALAGDVTLATLHNPDDSASEERSKQTKRGLQDAKPGRPMRKKNRRARLMPRAIELHRRGLSLREIGTLLGIAHMTVQGWLKRA